MVVGCEEVWREISNYVDGELDPALRAAMDSHIAVCLKCKAVLDGTRNVVNLYGDERLYQLPAGFSQRMRAKLERAMPKRRGKAWGWMVAFAAAMLVVGTFSIANSSAFVRPALRSAHAEPGIHVPSDMMVVVASDGKTFHAPGCRFIHDKNLHMVPAAEAIKEGYSPCVRCMKQYLSATALWIPQPLEIERYPLRTHRPSDE